MKPLPAPEVLGNTEAESMHSAVRMLFSASKAAFIKAETTQWARNRKNRAKKG